MTNFNVNFVGNKNKFFAFSAIVIAITVVACFVLGVNLDIQFKGGALITYSYEGDIEKDKFKSTVEDVVKSNVSIQESVDVSTGAKKFIVSVADVSGLNMDKQMELTSAVEAAFLDNKIQTESISVVNPTIGAEFLQKSMIVMAFASLLMVIYISLRFKKISGWSAGITAVIALFHDMFMVFAAFIIFKFSIDANFIAVCLTILGYSLSDTIVIYDRIRENKRIYSDTVSLSELVNKSLNQSLKRSIMTSLTTCTGMLVVSVVAVIYRVPSILSFSVPMLIGMIMGCYSSLCIAPSLWVIWQEKKKAK